MDEAFFDAVDTEEKAYWLGFITADGCVRTGGKFNLLQVKLKESDAGHLEKLKGSLRADYPIRFAAKSGVAGASATLAVTSSHLTQSLNALGVTPRKSLTVQPWDGPADLMRHYWRGLVDGDGCISKESNRAKWAVTLCGSESCVAAFAEWASSFSGTNTKPYRGSNIWYWKTSGLQAPQAVVRELYADASIYLDRKYEAAQLLLAEVPTRDRLNHSEFCVVGGCEKRASSRNMCGTHYRQQWISSGPNCIVSGCSKKRFARDYCSMHYSRLRKSEAGNLS